MNTPPRTDLRIVYRNCGRNSKPVMKLTLEGVELKRYRSILDAATSNGGISQALIKKVCDGKKESYDGFIWRYISLSGLSGEDNQP